MKRQPDYTIKAVYHSAKPHLPGSVRIDPTRQHIAYFAPQANSVKVCIDNVHIAEEETVEETTGIVFSASGDTFGYFASSGDRWVVVRWRQEHHTNGGSWHKEEFEAHEVVGTKSLVFSPNGDSFAYIAVVGSLSEVITGPNMNSGKAALFKDVVANSLTFSQNGKNLAFVALDDEDAAFVVQNGEEHQRFTGIGPLVFSSDGRCLAYAAMRHDKAHAVIINGLKGKEYQGIVQGTLTFDPKSQHSLYGAIISDDSVAAILDGSECELYDNIDQAFFTPHSCQPAIVGCRDGNWIVSMQESANSITLPNYAMLGSFVFSPDEKRYAYTANIDGSDFAVIDGRHIGPYPMVGHPSFSADSQHYAYAACVRRRFGRRCTVVIDSHPGERFYATCVGPSAPFRLTDVYRSSSSFRSFMQDIWQTDLWGEEPRFGERPVFSEDGRLVYCTLNAGRFRLWDINLKCIEQELT